MAGVTTTGSARTASARAARAASAAMSPPGLAFAALAFTAGTTGAPLPPVPGASPGPPDPKSSVPLRGDVAFVRNDGQWDEPVRFAASRGGAHVFLLGDRAEFRLVGRDADGRTVADAVTMRWDGLGATDVATGPRAPGARHFFRGNDPSEWRRHVPAFASVRYEGPACALEFHGRGGPLEYDLLVPPGGDASAVSFTFDGAEDVDIDPASGDLVVRTRHGEMRQTPPVVLQESPAGRSSVAGEFVRLGPATVGFRLGPADPSHGIRIDPAVRWSTWLGSTNDEAFACAGLPAGASIVVGKTASFDHVVTEGAFQTVKRPEPPAAGHDCFVTKFNAAGDVVWSTHFGGRTTTIEETAYGVAVDDVGRPWFCGHTGSPDFPLKNAVRSTHVGLSEAFLAALSSDGSDVYASTFLGGTSLETAWSVSRSPADGSFAVVGGTSSPDFPAVAAADGSLGGGQDGFIARVSADGRTLLSSTYLGGGGTDELRRAAHDAAGNLFVAGLTTSSGLATPGAAQTSRGASTDGIVAGLPADASAFTFITLVAGNSDDVVFGLAPTPAGDLAFCGQTSSSNLPVSLDAADPDADGQDGMVGLLAADGSSYRYLSYAGGSGADWFSDCAVLPGGGIVLAGRTRSSDFPLVSADAVKAAYSPAGGASDTDGTVVHLDETGRSLVFGTFFGGTTGATDGGDRLNGVAIDGNGGIVVCGASTASDFPQVNPAREGIAQSPVAVSVAARLGTDPAGTLDLRKGTLFNSLAAGGDRLGLKGEATLPAGADARFAPKSEQLSFAFGPVDAAQFSIVVRPRSKGYASKSGGRVVQYASRRGARPVAKLSLDARTGAFKASVTRFSLPAVPTPELELTFIAGDDGLADRRTWADEGGGSFRFPAD